MQEIKISLRGYGSVILKIDADALPLCEAKAETPLLAGLVSQRQQNTQALDRAEKIRDRFQRKAREVTGIEVSLFWS